MFRILIVDDEIHAVKGIVDGVNWERLEVFEIHEAYNAQQAKGILDHEPIDLMICDIEMPVMNGLSLLEWANTEHPGLKSILLTCHAEFKYAQRALQLRVRDYLLKPVIYEEMEKVVANNLGEIREKRNLNTQAEIFKKYYQLWHQQKPELIKSFWQEMMNGNGNLQQQKLEQTIRTFDLPLAAKDNLLLILLSIEEWKKQFSAFDEELMGYALRKAAEEVILPDHAGHVIKDELGNMLIILYLEDKENPGYDLWKGRCAEYIEACQVYFFCSVSCYIGEVSSIKDISLKYHELLEMEYSNITRHQQVLFYSEQIDSDKEPGGISFLHWTESLESGDMQQIELLLNETYDWIRQQHGKREALTNVFHGLLQVIYYVLLRKGISPDILYDQGLTSDPLEVTRSSAHLKQWMEGILRAVITLAEPGRAEPLNNSIVAKIQNYILVNLHHEITRDEISNVVHLNPSYLSRLFRMKTGMSLSEYILQKRMERAAELLTTTKDNISQIANSLGYDNFSYFAKMFKKVYQVSPQEFRKAL
ncbi:response regulator transcription factor [Paenibacillus sabinae]|uniref:AraC family transcriptional regulator n=1 Tax=Paenibacillus sabinae T27 TaxID=1268072 RepID=X5A1X7_9BACL|nr:helix-turn-helix domain-containing protein [Paenibacillus sabinae]AHV98333.1 AraC family transcriptional regulator [Paenibacillus sabinae T27]